MARSTATQQPVEDARLEYQAKVKAYLAGETVEDVEPGPELTEPEVVQEPEPKAKPKAKAKATPKPEPVLAVEATADDGGTPGDLPIELQEEAPEVNNEVVEDADED